MGHVHINQSKCGIVFYISFHSINMPAPVGFSACTPMLSHPIRESPAPWSLQQRSAGFCRLLLGPQIAANLFVASYHFGRFFPSLPRFYFPSQPAS